MGKCEVTFTYQDIVDALVPKLKDEGWVLVSHDPYMVKQYGDPATKAARPLTEVVLETISEQVAWGLPSEIED
jgi:hypothetical protein